MKIGTLHQVDDEIRGELRTLTVSAKVVFMPAPASKNDMASSDVVVANGAEVDAAWPAVPGSGTVPKVCIGDPTFPSPLIATLAETGVGACVSVWKQPR